MQDFRELRYGNTFKGELLIFFGTLGKYAGLVGGVYSASNSDLVGLDKIATICVFGGIYTFGELLQRRGDNDFNVSRFGNLEKALSED